MCKIIYEWLDTFVDSIFAGENYNLFFSLFQLFVIDNLDGSKPSISHFDVSGTTYEPTGAM